MKKIFCILILSFLAAYPNFAIDPPLVDTLEDEYIIVGSFIIHMSQMTEDNYKAASLTISDTQKVYYKSKFADGTWFRVDEGVEIKDVILKGNVATMKSDYMDRYFKFTLMVEPDGNLIKFGDNDGKINTNPQIVTLDELIKEKNGQIEKMMAQVKGDINEASNEAIVSEIAQLNYDKSLFENFDDPKTLEKQAIKEKLAEIEKAKIDNNIALEFELYKELEELDPSRFDKDSKLELLVNSLDDIESLNDLKAKFIANGLDNLLEELEVEIASKNELIEELSSKLIAENRKDLLLVSVSDEEKEKIRAMNSLINERLEKAKESAILEVKAESLQSTIEIILNDIASFIVNSDAGMKLKTTKTLSSELMKDGSLLSTKLNSILEDAGGQIEDVIEKESLTIDLIKNKLESLMLNLEKNQNEIEKFYQAILLDDFEVKSQLLFDTEKENKLLISNLEELAELEKLNISKNSLIIEIKLLSDLLAKDVRDLITSGVLDEKDLTSSAGNGNSADSVGVGQEKLSTEVLEMTDAEKDQLLIDDIKKLMTLKEEIELVKSSLNLDSLMDVLLTNKEKKILANRKLSLNVEEIDSIKELSTELNSALILIDQKELLLDERLNDSITGFNLSSDIEKLSNYSDNLVLMINRKFEAEMLALLKERYYLIKDYNSDKKKVYIENLDLYTLRIKEIDLEIHNISKVSYIDTNIVYIRYNYWLAAISRDYENQKNLLKIINEYKTLEEKLKLEEKENIMNINEIKIKLKELGFKTLADKI